MGLDSIEEYALASLVLISLSAIAPALLYLLHPCSRANPLPLERAVDLVFVYS